MSEKVKELRAQLEEARSRVREIDAENAGKYLDPSSSEGEEWNRLNEQVDELEKTISQCEAREARVGQLFESGRNTEAGAVFHTSRPGVARGDDIWDLGEIRKKASSPQEEGRLLQDAAKRAIERTTPAHEKANKEDAQALLERLQVGLDGESGEFSRHLLVTGSPAYRRAFVKGISGRSLTSEEQRALDLTGETGGFLLPYTLDPTVIPTSSGVTNPIRAMAEVKQTTTDKWKGVTSDGMVASYREAEGDETTDDSPKFGQPEIDCHAADAYAQWTYEFGQDYGSIAPDLAKMVQKAKDKLEAVKFLSGTGEKEPFGLATGATELIETITKEAFAVGDVYALEQAVPDEFRAEASWLGHRAQYNRIRQFDTAGGASLFVDNLRGGIGGNTVQGNVAQRLLDYPTNALSTMESGLTKLKTILFFGDYSYYVIADRIGTLVKPIDNIPGENGRPTGQEGLYFWWRNGAKVMSKTAFRGLKVKEL
jgi:HK97 family phage major capsid protein